MSRWNGGNVGREPVTLSTEIEDIWEHDDELTTSERYMGLRVVRIIPWKEPHILIAVEQVSVHGCTMVGLFDAEDWPLLCAWERHKAVAGWRDPDRLKPSRPCPQPLLAPALSKENR